MRMNTELRSRRSFWPWSEPGGTARGASLSPLGPRFPPHSSTRAGRDAQRPSRPSGGLGSPPASGGAAQRPTPPPPTRPVPAPTPPSALESWAAALIVPEPGTVGCRGESRGREPPPLCTCLEARPRFPRPSSRASAFSRGARLKVRSVAEGAGESVRVPARGGCVGDSWGSRRAGGVGGRVPAGRRGAASVRDRAKPGRASRGPGGWWGGGTRAGNFLPALELRAPAGVPGGRPAPGKERVCPPPPFPHFRPPQLPRSRLPGPVRPGGDPAAQPHPGRRGPLPRPRRRRRRAGADSLSQRGRRARQELTWTQIRGQPWSASSSGFGSGRNSSRTFYSLRRSLSSPCPICILSRTDVNVDTLEQVELIDLGDQDGADVFLPCEDPPPTPQTSGVDDRPEAPSLPVPTPDRTTSRTSSSSSDSSTNPNSADASDGGADTPLAQSDEEEDGGHDGVADPGACS